MTEEKNNFTAVKEIKNSLSNVTNSVTNISKANLISAVAVFALVGVMALNSTTMNKRFDSIETVLDQQNIVKEPEISTDLPYKKLGNFELTWYCPCEKCVGKKKKIRTATGTTPKANRTIAVDPTKIPLGSIIYIQGYGYYVAEDTGSAIKSNRIDIFVNSHQEALQLGKRHANVYLIMEGDK